jgi:CTP:molybdopterin cytidylyltransferase MocA
MELTGILLVGGASTRFHSPKALAELGGETLAARAWRLLGHESGARLNAPLLCYLLGRASREAELEQLAAAVLATVP